MKAPDFSLTPRERSLYGVTVTYVRVDTQPIQTTVRHEWDTTTGKAIGHAINRCDTLKGDWKIAVISSPPTIQRDMWGTRRVENKIQNKARTVSGSRDSGDLQTPEGMLLARYGRLDLWLDPTTHRILRGEQAAEKRAA